MKQLEEEVVIFPSNNLSLVGRALKMSLSLKFQSLLEIIFFTVLRFLLIIVWGEGGGI